MTYPLSWGTPDQMLDSAAATIAATAQGAQITSHHNNITATTAGLGVTLPRAIQLADCGSLSLRVVNTSGFIVNVYSAAGDGEPMIAQVAPGKAVNYTAVSASSWLSENVQ
jgi:hypothetical protein